ncbi:MAG TPA: prolyl oligopeptidase family serine peptidase, partial [Candidatus Thermoplasmatota archaeon]|nr:prolyl oligopeptidase family serine peptidase [Candidatus Thermoplasmatota archaeon]
MALQGRRTARVLAMLAIGACLLVAGCTQPGGRDRPGRDGAAGAGSQGDDGNATTAGAPPGRSPTTPTPPPPTNTTPAPPGNDTAGIPHGRLQRTVTVDGLERAFVVHVPQQVTGGTDVPVVFMLHGTGGNGSEYYVRSQWVEQADEDGLIAVFPTAATFCYAEDDDGDGTIGQGEYRIGTKWSAGKLGTPDMPLCGEDLIAQFPAARRADIESRVVVDDVAFFDAMVEALDEELPVDRHRMYVTGFSNGGSMSGRLMVERANTFAAFAMQAGGPTVDGLA